MMILEEKWKDFLGDSMEITSFDGFSCDHQMKMILVLTLTIRKDKHGQRH